MANTVHETDDNMLRSAVVQVNKASLLGLTDTVMGSLSPATVAGLKTQLSSTSDYSGTSAITVHETEANYIRQIKNGIQKMADLTVGMDTPGTVSGSNITTATSGGTLTDSTTYYFKFVAVDANGGLSSPSAQMSKATGSGGAGNAHTITLKNLTAVPGAASYRIYVATSSETFTLGYFAVTKANLEGSTGGTYTGQALTAGTIPTDATATAKAGVLNDDDVAAAKAASSGTRIASLVSKITENARTSGNVPASDDAGEQAMVS